MSLPAHQLGWMAGVIDLKGRVVVKKNSTRATGSRQVVLYVESKEAQIIRQLGRLTGLNPEMMRIPDTATFYRKPCSEHCPEAHSCVDETKYSFPQVARWTITGVVIVIILSNLEPFLMVDKGYGELIHQILEQASFTGRGSGATAKAVRRLQALGWDIPDEIAREVFSAEKAIAA